MKHLTAHSVCLLSDDPDVTTDIYIFNILNSYFLFVLFIYQPCIQLNPANRGIVKFVTMNHFLIKYSTVRRKTLIK